ncbi:MAG: hypothetical protein IT256_08445 [Chitinophagaceae bacterium]|nr:hypothetical protein [Chitinophagaceae bacterium]
MSQQPHTPDSSQPTLSNELLMAYLQGTLSPQEQHAVEALMTQGTSPDADALEGIQMLKPAQAQRSQRQLRRSLHRSLRHAQPRPGRPRHSTLHSLIIIGTLLLLLLLAYLVVHIASQ